MTDTISTSQTNKNINPEQDTEHTSHYLSSGKS